MPTDISFTGQRKDASTGLMFYNARYYDPVVGRFVNADTVVPGAGNPQVWNRYSYVVNNPIKHVDPSGHCPAPTVEGNGSVICVDLFISAASIGFLGIGDGDNRNFDSNSSEEQSRGYVYIYVDESGKYQGAESHINPSCLGNGAVCAGPFRQFNTFDVTQNPDTNEIAVNWNLRNGIASAADLGNDLLDDAVTMPHIGGTEAGAIASTFFHIGEGASPEPINGNLTLSPTAGGRFKLSGLGGDPYPSLEVYQYTGDRVLPLGLFREKYDAFYGLGPNSPRRTLPDTSNNKYSYD